MIFMPGAFFIVILGLLFILYMATWFSHYVMTKSNAKAWGFGTYKKFLSEFSKKEWERDVNYSWSFFGKNWSGVRRLDYIHACIIKFDDKGMVLNPLSYLLVIAFLFKHRVHGPKTYEKGLWE